MKRRITALMCALFMCLCSAMMPAAVSAEPAATEAAEIQQETAEGSPSRGAKIAGFLVIFTVAMGATAFIVARPKLKKLKEVRKQGKE